jgi:two-component system response regulator RegA
VTQKDPPYGVRRLLLVDDDHSFAQVVTRALVRRDFEVLVAHDAVSALRLADGSIDYAIVDLGLGDATGLDLLEPLKKANPSVRILLTSGYVSPRIVEDAIRLGATACVEKHVGIDTYVAILLSDIATLGNLE